uniref:E-selectin n=1 Tax=Gasterosteus aculeatus aculeatus TaxID=481459 RepID=G3PCW6_GASAC
MKSIKARPSGHKSQNHLNLRHGDTKDLLRIFFWSSHPPLNMFCFGLLQTRGPKTSWISLTFLCSIFCTWTNVECWSYYYSNKTMNWEEARTWCREHYTDMVAIQNQDEISHLNSWLPKASSYYWIGIRRINKVWTWVGTNKALTPEAANWAIGEPNNLKSRKRSMASEDCVEMYIKRDSQAGKWNDERCAKSKTALCYTAACKKDLCGHGDCVETINSYECACFEGFYGEKCDQVVQCDAEEVTAPDKASVNCIHKYGNFSYDSMCHYSCEEGYQLSMSRPLTCTASTRWSEPPPTCELVRCPVLSSPAGGSMKCSDPLGPSGYRSTCAFACDEGYVLAGSTSNTLQCEASGIWNASQPLCLEIGCPAPQIPTSGKITCSPSLSSLSSTGTSHPLGTVCTFSCDEGHELHGALSMECANPGRWTSAPPNCKVVQCPVLSSPAGGSIKCSDPLGPSGYRSTCAFACDEGYVLAGSTSNKLQCEASGIWNASQPLCLAIGCPAPKIPTSGQITCSPSLSSIASTGTSHPLGTVCTFSCDEGHELHGAFGMECANPGRWTSAPPNCKAVRCPSLEAPENGHINCSNSEPVFNSQCTFSCNQDYSLDGHELLTCDRHGEWTTGQKPTCQAPPSAVTAVASGVAAGGAMLSGLSLALWIMKRLKQKANKFELSSNSDIGESPQVYRNSITSLI